MVVTLDVEQGTRAWHEARFGIPTASQFSRIFTPGGKLSAQRTGYVAELLAEWALGEAEDELSSVWVERGKALEPEAFRFYSFHTDTDPQKVGFCFRDEKRNVGCSPDALVGEDGLLELKCPKASKHLLYLEREEVPKEYQWQVQGQLWVTGRKWCDFMSYHPGLPPVVRRWERDPKFFGLLDKHMSEFLDELEWAKKRLELAGASKWDSEEEGAW